MSLEDAYGKLSKEAAGLRAEVARLTDELENSNIAGCHHKAKREAAEAEVAKLTADLARLGSVAGRNGSELMNCTCTQHAALIVEVERLTRVANQQTLLLQAQDLELKQLRDVLGKTQQDLFKCHG